MAVIWKGIEVFYFSIMQAKLFSASFLLYKLYVIVLSINHLWATKFIFKFGDFIHAVGGEQIGAVHSKELCSK